jgi:hypothetical protein
MFLKSRVKKFYTNNDITIVGAAWGAIHFLKRPR